MNLFVFSLIMHVQDGVTALMRAVQGGHTDVVRLLLEEGAADPNLQTNAGGTALMHASFKGTLFSLFTALCLSLHPSSSVSPSLPAFFCLSFF